MVNLLWQSSGKEDHFFLSPSIQMFVYMYRTNFFLRHRAEPTATSVVSNLPGMSRLHDETLGIPPYAFSWGRPQRWCGLIDFLMHGGWNQEQNGIFILLKKRRNRISILHWTYSFTVKEAKLSPLWYQPLMCQQGMSKRESSDWLSGILPISPMANAIARCRIRWAVNEFQTSRNEWLWTIHVPCVCAPTWRGMTERSTTRMLVVL